MDTLSDFDPKIVEAVLANAGKYIDAHKRVQEILDEAQSKVKKIDEVLAKQLSAGVSEETAVEEYIEANKKIHFETEALMKELTREYETKYPAVE